MGKSCSHSWLSLYKGSPPHLPRQHHRGSAITQFFVANQMTKGAIFGQDFSNAHTLFYYSHHFSLERWLQSIDRVETLARTWSLAAVVFTAVDTVDELILAAHAEKRRLSDVVLGRHPKELF